MNEAKLKALADSMIASVKKFFAREIGTRDSRIAALEARIVRLEARFPSAVEHSKAKPK